MSSIILEDLFGVPKKTDGNCKYVIEYLQKVGDITKTEC